MQLSAIQNNKACEIHTATKKVSYVDVNYVHRFVNEMAIMRRGGINYIATELHESPS